MSLITKKPRMEVKTTTFGNEEGEFFAGCSSKLAHSSVIESLFKADLMSWHSARCFSFFGNIRLFSAQQYWEKTGKLTDGSEVRLCS